jgi:hypothetical protein
MKPRKFTAEFQAVDYKYSSRFTVDYESISLPNMPLAEVERPQELQQCVLVPDIVDLICGEVEKFPSQRYRTLKALARTCRLFQESALNRLWCELESLAPLIMCMPEDLWRVEGGDLV